MYAVYVELTHSTGDPERDTYSATLHRAEALEDGIDVRPKELGYANGDLAGVMSLMRHDIQEKVKAGDVPEEEVEEADSQEPGDESDVGSEDKSAEEQEEEGAVEEEDNGADDAEDSEDEVEDEE